jgi:hypothetical protein
MSKSTPKIYLEMTMTNLTDRERELLVEYFFNFETACLVENLMLFMPEDLLKDIGQKLAEGRDETED